MYLSGLKENPYFAKGMWISVGGHLLIFIYMIIVMSGGFSWKKPQVVYSVSLESGSIKGGISQVPKDDKKQPLAAAKKVSEEKTKQEEVKETKPVKEVKPEVKVQEVKKEVKKIEQIKTAEEIVRLNQKKEEIKKEEPKKIEEKKQEQVAKKVTEPVKQPVAVAKPAQPVQKASLKPAKKEPAIDLDKEYQKAMQRYLGESTNAGGQGFGGDGRVGQGLGGGVQKPAEYFQYLNLLQRHVKRGWNWHEQQQMLQALVSFKLSAQGEISAIQLARSSGNILYDQSVLRAVEKANPAPVPPQAVYEDFKYVELEFIPE
jgi:colicin import membrane protein